MKLNILYPPSVNTLFTNRRGSNGKKRIPTDRYRVWRRAVDTEIMVQGRECFEGPVIVAMTFCKPDRRKRDLDNLLKAPIDMLVRNGILADDDQIVRLSAAWGDCNTIEVIPAWPTIGAAE